jgi:two-component system KDP operon response regulator KdpE
MSTPTVLVVDDEPQIRRVMRTTLSSNGYTVLEARSGEEADSAGR